jgi:phenylpyruvate tautomerase PptA (4-oxalocrotonate tautomerase family)
MLHIRTGRSEEYKTEMVQRLWTLFQSATQASDNQMVVAISEVPPGQAMEMGKVLPVVAKE